MSAFTDISKIDLKKYYFDEKMADMAVRYIETHCYHAEGPLSGTPLILQDWQKERIIKPLFGWKQIKPTEIKDANGNVVKRFNKRKFSTLHMEVPKKSGKGTLSSAIIQLLMDIDQTEDTMQVVGLAWGREQAKIVWDMVNKSMKASARAKDKFTFYAKSILSKDSKRVYKVWSKETGSNDGQMPSVVLADELHEHKSGTLLEMAEKSTITRAQPLTLITTTAGSNLEGIGFERSEYAKKVSKGIIKDDTLLVCVYCAEKDDDIYNPKVWKAVHPMLGVSISMDKMQEFANKAKASAAAENSFKRYYLNIWNNTKSQWISDTVWMESMWDFDTTELIGKPCWGGLDLSSTTDTTAFSLVFPVGDGYVSLNWFFLPEEKTKESINEEKIRQYVGWIRDGYIVETEGNVIDKREVVKTILDQCEKYDVQAIAYDPHLSVDVVHPLTEEGVNCVAHGQGIVAMTFPTSKFEELVLSKKFNHLGNPVLRWMNTNCSLKEGDSGAMKPDKVTTGSKRNVRNDGIVSNIMACGLACDPSNVSQKSYLEETGGEIFSI